MGTFENIRGREEKPSGLAILLSAVVFPGAGQYMQKRLVAGTFYAAVFLFCVVFLFKELFTPIFLNLRALEKSVVGAQPAVYYPASWQKILLWTAVSLFVYLANLLDVFVFYRKRFKNPKYSRS